MATEMLRLTSTSLLKSCAPAVVDCLTVPLPPPPPSPPRLALFSDFISSLPPLPLPRLGSRRPRPRPAHRRRRIGGELRDCPGDFIALINMAANANSLHVMTVIAHARRNAAAATQRRNAGQRRGGRSEAPPHAEPSRAAPRRVVITIFMACQRRVAAAAAAAVEGLESASCTRCTCQIRGEFPALRPLPSCPQHSTAHSFLSLSFASIARLMTISRRESAHVKISAAARRGVGCRRDRDTG